MGRKALVRAVLVAAATVSSVVAAGAVPALAGPAVTAAAATVTSRDLVFRLSDNPNIDKEVRAEAYNAWIKNDDAAVKEFLATGYAKARSRAQQRIALNLRYITDIEKYSIPGSAVQATSRRALAATAHAQDEYVLSGHERAQELDRVNDNRYVERLARLTKEDRDYVTFLAGNDPGTQVRTAAQRAVAGDDTSVGLFFKYYWRIGAELDADAFRRATLEQDAIWRSKISSLIEAALAAERAEREAAGELARKARLEAIANWEKAGELAGGSSVDWSGEQRKADAQAAAWRAVAEKARLAQTEQDWAAILAAATTSNASWQDEANWARDQAATWRAKADEMRAAAEAAKNRDRGER